VRGKLDKVSFIFSCFGSPLDSPLWNVKERKFFGPYLVGSFKFHMHSAVQPEEAFCFLGALGKPT
jgi:hypothetical protein